MGALLRTLLITDPLIVLSTTFFGLVNLFVAPFDRSGRKQVALSRVWSRSLLRITGVRVTIEGLDKISLDRNYVFVANHLSYMDTPVVLASIPLPFRFMAKSGLFSIPLVGTHLKTAGHIPVPLENPRAAVKSMTEAGRIIREREISVLLFPEGGRSENGKLQPFKEGAAYIAIKAGVPVVPISLEGTWDVMAMGAVTIRPGPVRIRITDPIPTADLALRDRGALTEQIYQRIADLLGEPVRAAS